MKKSNIFTWARYALIITVFISNNGCENPLEQFSPEQYLGRVKVLIGVEMDVVDQGSRRLEVNTGEFIVEVLTASEEVVKSFDRYADIIDDILLEPGNYYVRVKSAPLMEFGFDKPYYEGSSEIFSIDYEEEVEISISASLANCVVTVSYSQSVKDKFLDYYTNITSNAGELTYIMDETREGFFAIEPLQIESFLTYETPEGLQNIKVITGLIESPLPKHHYQVQINADLAEGLVPLQLIIDESRITEIVLLEETNSSIPDGPINYGDLLITEIMYNPDAVTDTEGEYFEIYNNSGEIIDLYQLVVRKGIEFQFEITDQVTLDPGSYFVLAKHVNATSNADFIYGSALTLPNTGEQLVLANYGSDGSNGQIIAEVNYGLVTFPIATGAALNLSPLYFDANLAKDGNNWCLSTEIFETGDLGTPGIENINCN